MREPRAASDGLVGQEIKAKPAVKLKPTLVDQQARRNADAGRNAVAEKLLPRRRRDFGVGTVEKRALGGVLLERAIEPIDRRLQRRRRLKRDLHGMGDVLHARRS